MFLFFFRLFSFERDYVELVLIFFRLDRIVWGNNQGMEIYFSGVFKLQIQLYTYELFKCVVHWVYFGSFFMDPFHLAYQFYVFAYRAVNFSVLSPSYKFCYTVFSF